MEEVHIDGLTVIIAAIIYVIVGAIWYSPLLFGNAWMRLAKMKKSDKPKMWPALIGEFITALVISFFLALLFGFLGATSTMDGIYVAIGVWIGFVATTHLSAVFWKKMPFPLYLIQVGYWFVGFIIMGGILGA